MAATKGTDAVAGPSTPAGPPIVLDREAQDLVAEGERITRAALAAEEQVELPMLMRSVFGDTAFASINGVSIKAQTGVTGQKVAKSFYDLLVTRQNAALKQEAEAQARSGR